ncbi:MAG: nucleotidyltransferase family protein [Dongiaceae bacterium]
MLEAVRQQHLPDWAVGAGFIRSAVWDALHGYRDRTLLPDVDVLYFDRDDMSCRREAAIEEALTKAMADVPWSVRNQARMHLRNGDPPYTDTADALRFWLETPTAVAIRIDDAGSPSLLAPFGTGDLTGIVCCPTPRGREKLMQYRQRIRGKNWPARWPRVRILDL